MAQRSPSKLPMEAPPAMETQQRSRQYRSRVLRFLLAEAVGEKPEQPVLAMVAAAEAVAASLHREPSEPVVPVVRRKEERSVQLPAVVVVTAR